MSERKAKELRKKVYGDLSLKLLRTYIRRNDGSIYATGLRRQYQDAKENL